jgi:hypothetical protein
MVRGESPSRRLCVRPSGGRELRSGEGFRARPQEVGFGAGDGSMVSSYRTTRQRCPRPSICRIVATVEAGGRGSVDPSPRVYRTTRPAMAGQPPLIPSGVQNRMLSSLGLGGGEVCNQHAAAWFKNFAAPERFFDGADRTRDASALGWKMRPKAPILRSSENPSFHGNALSNAFCRKSGVLQRGAEGRGARCSRKGCRRRMGFAGDQA